MPSAAKRKFSKLTSPVVGTLPVADPPVVKRETITPDIANRWLETFNTNNRSIRDSHVDLLAHDMAVGHWKENGDAICFSKDGRLIDGQHRLWACVQSGAQFTSLVVRGIDDDAYMTKDAGLRKTAGDFMGPMDGEKNVTLLSAALRPLWVITSIRSSRPSSNI